MRMNEEAEKVVQKIVEETDISEEEVLEEIEEIQDDLSGFITEEGAANIVAKNHNVSVEREEPEVRKLLIEDVSEGMSNIDIVGRVSRVFEPTEFERKDGSKGKVANLVLMDKTGEIRTVLWGKMTKLVSEGELQKGTPVRFERVYVKKGQDGSKELHLNPRGEVEIEPADERVEDLPPISDEPVKISDLDPSAEFVDIVGRVIAVSEPREFERSDKSKGKVATLRIIDETGQCRVSLWDDKAEKTKDIEQGDAILFENATVREGLQDTIELSITRRSRIIQYPDEEVDQLPEFEKKLLKIEEIEPDMSVLDLAARVQRTTSPNEFSRDDGSTGRVMNVVLGDETGTIRASFWDDMVDIGKELSPGDLVLLENARSSTGLRDKPEVRVGGRASVEVNPEGMEVGEMESKMVRVSDVEEGLDSIELVGRVVDTSDVSEFTRDDESEGKVGSLTLGDETGTIRVTLWEDKTSILENLEEGEIIKIKDAYSVSGDYGGPEVHVEEQGEVVLDPEVDRSVPAVEDIGSGLSDLSRMEIGEVEQDSQVKVRGTVVKVFERQPIFNVCPHCGRNLGSEDSEEFCDECDEKVEPEHRAVINLILDDGTDSIRVVAFGDLAEDLLGKTAEEVSNALTGGLELSDVYSDTDLEGMEIIVSGTVRRDDYFEQLEIRAREIEFPDPIEETKRILEKIEGGKISF